MCYLDFDENPNVIYFPPDEYDDGYDPDMLDMYEGLAPEDYYEDEIVIEVADVDHENPIEDDDPNTESVFDGPFTELPF